MLNFRNTNIFFTVLFLALIGVQYYEGFDISWFIALVLLYAAVLFYGSFYIRANFFLKAFCGGSTSRKVISLSFDDGPSPDYTPRILRVLQEHSITAAFFLIGEEAEEQPELVKQIVGAGHLVGDHSFYHGNWFDLQSVRKMKTEMQQTQDLVHQLTGKQMNWFRPPYGVTNPNVRNAVMAMGYQVIGWNVRSLDTLIKDHTRLLERLKRMIKPGSLILLHDTRGVTVEILPDLINYVKAQGYEIVGPDELLDLQPYKSS